MKIDQKIPEGWSIKKLGEIGTFVSGGTPDTEKPEYWNGNIVWLTPSEITKLKTRFVSDSERKITELGLKNSSAVLLPKNSLIICTRATIGDCCINTKEISTNQGFKNLIPNNNCTDFLYYLISIHKSDLIRRACGSTFLEISKHDIEKLKYVFPPLAEQEKIAEILSCWDEGIEKLSALIEKKKIQKKALMQQLLTGKHRLKGFSTPWHEVRLGELIKSEKISLEKGKNLTAEQLKKGDIPVIAGGKTVPYYHDSYTHDKPSITISASGAYAGYVWFHKEKIWASDCNVMQGSESADIIFWGYILQNQQDKIYRLQTGGAQPHVYSSDIKSLIVPELDIAEQKAIADILSKADEEIELLNKKLEAFKLEKKALMQKLLTGQIRVKAV